MRFSLRVAREINGAALVHVCAPQRSINENCVCHVCEDSRPGVPAVPDCDATRAVGLAHSVGSLFRKARDHGIPLCGALGLLGAYANARVVGSG